MNLFFNSTSKKKNAKATRMAPSPNSKLNSAFSDSSSSSSGAPSSPISVLPPSIPAVGVASSTPTFTSSFDLALPSPARITRQEVELLLRRLVGEEAAALLDGDGMVMLEHAVSNGGRAREDELRGAFAVFDADGDGKISAEELQGAFAVMGDADCSIEDCRRMIGGVDSDGDGLVSFGDFARMMTSDCGISVLS